MNFLLPPLMKIVFQGKFCVRFKFAKKVVLRKYLHTCNCCTCKFSATQCTVVGISHCSPKLDLSINPGSASILYSLHKIVPLFGRKIAQRHSAPPAPRARVETFASNGLLINYLNPKLPYQHKLYKVL